MSQKTMIIRLFLVVRTSKHILKFCFEALQCCSCSYLDITGNEVFPPVSKAPFLAHLSFKNGKNKASKIAMLHVATCVCVCARVPMCVHVHLCE